jgi:hypothetical protein
MTPVYEGPHVRLTMEAISYKSCSADATHPMPAASGYIPAGFAGKLQSLAVAAVFQEKYQYSGSKPKVHGSPEME